MPLVRRTLRAAGKQGASFTWSFHHLLVITGGLLGDRVPSERSLGLGIGAVAEMTWEHNCGSHFVFA